MDTFKSSDNQLNVNIHKGIQRVTEGRRKPGKAIGVKREREESNQSKKKKKKWKQLAGNQAERESCNLVSDN